MFVCVIIDILLNWTKIKHHTWLSIISGYVEYNVHLNNVSSLIISLCLEPPCSFNIRSEQNLMLMHAWQITEDVLDPTRSTMMSAHLFSNKLSPVCSWVQAQHEVHRRPSHSEPIRVWRGCLTQQARLTLTWASLLLRGFPQDLRLLGAQSLEPA